MGAVETYNVRVGLQEVLDALFPIGAWITVLEEIDGKLIPTGVEMTTGRVFCSDAIETDRGWHYQLFIDPRRDEVQEQGEYDRPFTAWVTELNTEMEPLIQAQIEPTDPFDEAEVLEVLRLRSDPVGPRRILPGQRELITALREEELFPRGLRRIELEVVPDV